MGAVQFVAAHCLSALLGLLGALAVLAIVCRCRRRADGPAIAFFHPYCNDGGGGERVLWVGIASLLAKQPGLKVAIFTGDSATPEEILKHTKDRFDIDLPLASIEFVYLSLRAWAEASRYPRLTLLGQSLGSIVLAIEAVMRLPAPVFVDTTGYAFSFPVARYIGGCAVGCYVHYPTISTDMLAAVASRKAAHNNSAAIAASPLKSNAKLLYYKLFAAIYGLVGRRADVVMANSSWTKGHIVALWGADVSLVYPPCNTVDFQALPLDAQRRHASATVLSIAQFRPEKAHGLQLEAFAKMLETTPSLRGKARLTLAGACRHADDESRLAALKKQAQDLGIDDAVSFEINVPFARLKELMGSSAVGIHTMWNEHFGIGVVEMMAAGLGVVAHDSAGPKEDIVVDFEGAQTGRRAVDVSSYAQCMAELLGNAKLREQLATNGRKSVARFSDEAFAEAFSSRLLTLLPGGAGGKKSQ